MTRSPAPEIAAHWARFHREGCEKSREWLILEYLPLVELTRKRVVPIIPWRVAVEDLDSEGTLALIKAVDRFDPGRGVQFPSMAITWLRGALLEYLRKEDWTPRLVRRKHGALRQAVDRLHLAGEGFSAGACAAEMGLDADEFARFRATSTPRAVISLEDVKHDDEEGSDPLNQAAALVDPAPPPEVAVLARLDAQALWAEVASLPEHYQEVFRRYYVDGETLKVISKHLERSESRAHQMLAHGLERLRVRDLASVGIGP